MIKVLLIQRIIAPYRFPFFEKLSQSPLIDITFAYGKSHPQTASFNILNPNKLKTVYLTNIFGPKERTIYQKGLLTLIRSKRYSVIIAEFGLSILSNLLAFVFAKKYGIKFIWWGHGYSKNPGDAEISLRLWLAKHADALIFYDAVQAEKYISWGIAKQKIFVAPNSIDVESIIPLVKQTPFDQRNRILFIGRLTTRKKVSLLIRSFARAYEKLRPDSILTIIGDGPERPHLQNLAKNLGIEDKVEFTGAIYDMEKLAPWFNSSLVSVSPGPVGLSAIHSLAFGLPMLVGKNEPHSVEVSSLKENVNCIFFPSDNIEALSARLIYLSENKELLELMSLEARQTIQRYSLSNMVEAFEKAITSSMKLYY
jgi:glycosyltransferase involved in cell wall biosynthesis